MYVYFRCLCEDVCVLPGIKLSFFFRCLAFLNHRIGDQSLAVFRRSRAELDLGRVTGTAMAMESPKMWFWL